MSLLGKKIVEEWLNRNGYFTMRGIKIGGDEIEILAIKPLRNGQHDCRHVEIQVSDNPMGYMEQQDDAELMEQVRQWIEEKFDQSGKADLRRRLCPGKWTKELVVGHVEQEEEITLLKRAGIVVHRLRDILSERHERHAYHPRPQSVPV